LTVSTKVNIYLLPELFSIVEARRATTGSPSPLLLPLSVVSGPTGPAPAAAAVPDLGPARTRSQEDP